VREMPRVESPAPPDQHSSRAEVVRMEGVCKRLQARNVLNRLDLSLYTGENLAILGKSGTGKSVFLKLVSGLMIPDTGTVSLFGGSTVGLSEREWLPLRRRIGFVFQSGALFDSMTVGDNIAFPLREEHRSEDEVSQIVAERLEWVGLQGTQERRPSELSGGMRRRVALARTLARRPELLLYDEPTSGLDPITSRRVGELLKELGQRVGSTSILVTHDVECARAVSHRWAYLGDGRLMADGPPEALLTSDEGEVREFFAGEKE